MSRGFGRFPVWVWNVWENNYLECGVLSLLCGCKHCSHCGTNTGIITVRSEAPPWWSMIAWVSFCGVLFLSSDKEAGPEFTNVLHSLLGNVFYSHSSILSVFVAWKNVFMSSDKQQWGSCSTSLWGSAHLWLVRLSSTQIQVADNAGKLPILS